MQSSDAHTEEIKALLARLDLLEQENCALQVKIESQRNEISGTQRLLQSQNPISLVILADTSIYSASPVACELFNIKPSLFGQKLSALTAIENLSTLLTTVNRVLETKQPASVEVNTAHGEHYLAEIIPVVEQTAGVAAMIRFEALATVKTRADLETKSQRMELAWEAANGGILEHAIPVDGTTYVSNQWAKVLGYSADELPDGEALLNWLTNRAHAEDKAVYQNAYLELFNGNADQRTVEMRLQHRNGKYVWVRKIIKVLARDDNNQATRLLKMMIDINDLKSALASLVESETRFDELADSLPLMVWFHPEEGNAILVNEAYCDFFGVSKEYMREGNLNGLVHPLDEHDRKSRFYHCLAERIPYHNVVRARHAGGDWRWIESWGHPRYSSDGTYRGFVGVSNDITERRKIEDVLHESEARFRMLADNISQLAWMTDYTGWIFWYNQRWYDYTGTTLDTMAGWGWQAVHHPDHVDRVTAKIRQCFETGQDWEDTFPLRSASGEYRWFLSRAIAIRDDNGDIVRWFGTNTDITERRNVEAKLVEADRQKDEFISMLGHELRNPLAAIRNASDLLRFNPDADASVKRIQQILDRQTTHMMKLIDGLLDISRIIHGKINLDRSVFDLGEICRNVINDLSSQVAPRRLAISTEISSAPCWLNADSTRIIQVISNLLFNAVKYTPDGGEVKLRLGQSREQAVLQVSDTGVGIEAEFLPYVFDVFRQNKQNIDRSAGGLGLGLALVKMLVELHGGSVLAASGGTGKGATFTVKLPLTEAPVRSLSETLDAGASSAVSIVLIEDNHDAGTLLKELLELLGHQVMLCTNGRQGIATVQQVVPDLVICDIGLPDGVSGFDVAKKLSGDASLHAVKLVALTGYGRPEDVALSQKSGFHYHLTKPVELGTITRILNDVKRA